MLFHQSGNFYCKMATRLVTQASICLGILKYQSKAFQLCLEIVKS